MITVLCLLTGLSSSVRAQKKISDEDFKITQKEKAVLGFFRLAGMAPDYESWIKAGPKYKSFPDKSKEKTDFLIEETLRLGQGYSNFNPAKTLLEFNTLVITTYTPPTGNKPALFHFKFPSQTEDYIPVFEYPYGDNSIALVLNKFADFSTIKLTDDQYEKDLKTMPYQDEEYTARLFIEVKLIKSDLERPIVHQNIYQWMMLGEVVYMRCQIIDPTNMGQTKLWEYISPWYEKEMRSKNMSEEEKYPHPYDLFKDKK